MDQKQEKKNINGLVDEMAESIEKIYFRIDTHGWRAIKALFRQEVFLAKTNFRKMKANSKLVRAHTKSPGLQNLLQLFVLFSLPEG